MMRYVSLRIPLVMPFKLSFVTGQERNKFYKRTFRRRSSSFMLSDMTPLRRSKVVGTGGWTASIAQNNFREISIVFFDCYMLRCFKLCGSSSYICERNVKYWCRLGSHSGFFSFCRLSCVNRNLHIERFGFGRALSYPLHLVLHLCFTLDISPCCSFRRRQLDSESLEGNNIKWQFHGPVLISRDGLQPCRIDNACKSSEVIDKCTYISLSPVLTRNAIELLKAFSHVGSTHLGLQTFRREQRNLPEKDSAGSIVKQCWRSLERILEYHLRMQLDLQVRTVEPSLEIDAHWRMTGTLETAVFTSPRICKKPAGTGSCCSVALVSHCGDPVTLSLSVYWATAGSITNAACDMDLSQRYSGTETTSVEAHSTVSAAQSPVQGRESCPCNVHYSKSNVCFLLIFRASCFLATLTVCEKNCPW